tara:strand:- start:4883 stop:5170 length:288 start_codon:yes stop_codon:yes gene_type:complete
MKEFIKNTLIALHHSCTTDKYGQVHISNFTPSVFGHKEEDVKQYCKENKDILRYGTYGASYGTYTAFTIICPEIKKVCSDALKKNEHYLKNINSL